MLLHHQEVRDHLILHQLLRVLWLLALPICHAAMGRSADPMDPS
jgi:hypothetical protein